MSNRVQLAAPIGLGVGATEVDQETHRLEPVHVDGTGKGGQPRLRLSAQRPHGLW